MLVLSRKAGEEIVLPNHGVTIGVLAISGKRIRLGITAPSGIPVHRREIQRRTPEATGAHPKSNGNSPEAIRVMIADTDEQLLASYSESLSQEGFGVATVSSGLDCVCQLRAHPPDLLVLEPELPWGGSCGVLAMMREEPDVPLVPVLIHAADNDKAIHRDTAFPVVGHERKPLLPGRLADRIRRLVGHFRRQSPITPSARPQDDLSQRLEGRIRLRTGNRIGSLRVETIGGQVIVHGCSRSNFDHELACSAAREVFNASVSDRTKRLELDIKVRKPR